MSCVKIITMSLTLSETVLDSECRTAAARHWLLFLSDWPENEALEAAKSMYLKNENT